MRLLAFLPAVQCAVALGGNLQQIDDDNNNNNNKNNNIVIHNHHLQQRGMDHADILASRKLPDLEFFRNQALEEKRTFCVVEPDENGGDDASSIMGALNKECRDRGLVFMPGPLYHIASNMTTMGMDDVKIFLLGRMLWTPDVNYWRSVSMPIGFQNQSTVWYFGGKNVTWDGLDAGTLDGNGQVWYDWARSEGNLPRRPMNINFRELSHSVIRNLRFVQSQMWTMAVTHSHAVELTDIYVNSTSSSQWSTLNTDGCDTVYSDDITFRRWFVKNGDDAIALKGNSSRISVYDSEFHDGQGVAIGSMGQYDGKFEYITDFYARNITLVNTAHVSYLKTWAGVSRGFPPNGGGGGIGHASNITMEDIRITRLRQQPFFAWQCENYSGFAGKDCNSSLFKMNNVTWANVTGTVTKDVRNVGSFQCSAAANGCHHFKVSNIDISSDGRGKLDKWHCENVRENTGFTCNDPPQRFAYSNNSSSSSSRSRSRRKYTYMPYI
ncbi:Pectin lyase fold protein [Metarhizium rileyi]|uniref:Pectin lyase fold protein n=1 Tax=Metarhizium rileyi (strain RCEF 4871) TaxID=1649241 RepID=A0A167KNA9_METRR|nr:Pectin lyase fold protein [Metarhizium rileyi RCEF 4871]